MIEATFTTPDDPWQGPKESCGVVGIYTHPAKKVETARLAFFALFALQHRGQESAGIATCSTMGANLHKGMGLVSHVFTEANLAPLKGSHCIGHNRYSTTGSSSLRNAQPFLLETMHGPLGVGHNGNITNVAALRRRLLEKGVGLISSTDSEVITQMLSSPPAHSEKDGPDWFARITSFMALAEGAYSLVILMREAVYVLRDPQGFRPLCLGEIRDKDGNIGYVATSESCALGTIGAKFIREVEPGEIVRMDKNGLTSLKPALKPKPPALCIFEYVYFSRPDSEMEGRMIHGVRQEMGVRLGQESPAIADVVIGVPDSAIPAAIGYSQATGIPYTEGLIKNRYIGRTFIQPTDRLRKSSVHLKYNALRGNLEGKRVVLVDDSIVRGNTVGPIVKLLREQGGATEVHVRVSSPPVKHPCFMGVDLATHAQLIAHRLSVDEICKEVQADSLAYLSIEGLRIATKKTAPQSKGHCNACFSGRYPLDIDAWLANREQDKMAFETVQGG